MLTTLRSGTGGTLPDPTTSISTPMVIVVILSATSVVMAATAVLMFGMARRQREHREEESTHTLQGSKTSAPAHAASTASIVRHKTLDDKMRTNPMAEGSSPRRSKDGKVGLDSDSDSDSDSNSNSNSNSDSDSDERERQNTQLVKTTTREVGVV